MERKIQTRTFFYPMHKQKIFKISRELKYNYLDLLPVFENQSEEDIWNDYDDPHPSAYAHKLMADKIFKYFNK